MPCRLHLLKTYIRFRSKGETCSPKLFLLNCLTRMWANTRNALSPIRNDHTSSMKHLLAFYFLALVASPLAAQTSDYKVSSYLAEGFKAPNTNYEGEAWLNFVLQSDTGFIYNLTHAHFKANSTLDWHYHATPQVLVVVDGVGYYQERGKDPILMKEGDVIRCEKGVEHWHSSSAESDVSYVAIYGSSPTTWTEKLSREAYQAVAELLSTENH